MKMKTEKEHLDTMETYIKVTMARLRDGRIIDGYKELETMLTMTTHRKLEITGKAPWIDQEGEYNGVI